MVQKDDGLSGSAPRVDGSALVWQPTGGLDRSKKRRWVLSLRNTRCSVAQGDPAKGRKFSGDRLKIAPTSLNLDVAASVHISAVELAPDKSLAGCFACLNFRAIDE